MRLHANAALSLKARARMVEQVLAQDRSIALAAEAAGVSERTCAKWVARYRSGGREGLLDRSSAPDGCTTAPNRVWSSCWCLLTPADDTRDLMVSPESARSKT